LYLNPNLDPKVIGLFSAIDSAVLSNIRLENVNISTSHNTGGLVGEANDSQITNCFVSGIINASEKARYVGGIVAIARSTLINECSSHVHINGLPPQCDQYDHNANFAMSGGLVAAMVESTMSNSYFRGAITRHAKVSGGLVGHVDENSIVRYCYVAPIVHFPNEIKYNYSYIPPIPVRIGALISSLDFNNVSVKNNFFDKQVSGIDKRDGISLRTRLDAFMDRYISHNRGFTTARMHNRRTYTRRGWDFDDIWGIDPNVNDGYPFLKKLHAM
jgi:hypothetical protein